MAQINILMTPAPIHRKELLAKEFDYTVVMYKRERDELIQSVN